MIYELRTYHAVPGKLQALHARFVTGALPLFEKHGITPVGFWTTYIGPSNNQLIYLLEWEDLGERQRRWDDFSSDPEWLRIKAETERDGPLTERVQSTILKPTDYSPMK
jgi:hypothetical protein